MKQETIVRRARDKTLKYAEKQHRYRAKTIALDELAEVYNQGAHFGIKQAQKKGYIGHVRKVWVTARQEACVSIVRLWKASARNWMNRLTLENVEWYRFLRHIRDAGVY